MCLDGYINGQHFVFTEYEGDQTKVSEHCTTFFLLSQTFKTSGLVSSKIELDGTKLCLWRFEYHINNIKPGVSAGGPCLQPAWDIVLKTYPFDVGSLSAQLES